MLDAFDAYRRRISKNGTTICIFVHGAVCNIWHIPKQCILIFDHLGYLWYPHISTRSLTPIASMIKSGSVYRRAMHDGRCRRVITGSWRTWLDYRRTTQILAAAAAQPQTCPSLFIATAEISWNLGQITSYPYCLRQKYTPKNLVFSNFWERIR